MAERKLVKSRTYLHCSSSVENFEEKIIKNWGLKRRTYHLFSPTFFCGLYHIIDYLKFIFHFGKRYVLWCGSDILNLNYLWAIVIRLFRAEHYCENFVEQTMLRKYGIKARVRPVFFDEIDKFPISYKQSDNPNVFLCIHPDREEEYGLNVVRILAHELPDVNFYVYGIEEISEMNIFFKGQMSNEQFNEEIKNYQCGLRLNAFDGFSEVTAKSILMGQYPITKITYPWIDYADNIDDIIALLKSLKYNDKPNHKAREYWLKNINNLPFLKKCDI